MTVDGGLIGHTNDYERGPSNTFISYDPVQV